MRVHYCLLVVLAVLVGFPVTGTAASGEWDEADLAPVERLKAPSHNPVVLVHDAKAVASVSVPGYPAYNKTPLPLRGAVDDFIMYLKLITGAELPVVYGKRAAKGLVVGNCEEARALGLDGSKMPNEGFEIRTTETHVYVVGRYHKADASGTGDVSGSAWGLYDLLERRFGVRWFMPYDFGAAYEKRTEASIPATWYRDAPHFKQRWIWPSFSNGIDGKILLDLHRRMRAANTSPVKGRCHAPFAMGEVREEYVRKYGEELMQLNSDGGRDKYMYCYSSPALLNLYIDLIEKYDGTDGKSLDGVIGETVTVSPWDSEVLCRCKPCMAQWDKDGGALGTASPVISGFVLKLANVLNERWPHKTIWYCPYNNYAAAPKGDFRFPGNVVVQPCFKAGIAMFKEPDVSAEASDILARWYEVTGRPVRHWQYPCWPESSTPAVYQYPHVIREFYAKHLDKSAGTFINGETDHWPRQNVTLYYWLRMLWSPDVDLEAILDSFCSRMFGPAARTMRELLQLQMDGWEKSRWPGGKLSAKNVFDVSYPDTSMNRFKELFVKAFEEAEGNELVIRRLKYYEAPFEAFYKRWDQFRAGAGAPFIVKKVGERLALDGRLDETLWQRTEPVGFMPGTRQFKDVIYPTEVRALYDWDGVTFGFRLSEPNPEHLMTKNSGRDGNRIWWDDNVEILLDVTGRGEGEFYHFIITSTGDYFDAHNKDSSWNTDEIRIGTHVGKDFWSLEVYLPYTLFPDAAVPKSGSRTRWMGNFTRHRLSDARLNSTIRREGSMRVYTRLNSTFSKVSANLDDFVVFKFQEQ